MANTALERLRRQERLVALSRVVLLSSRSANSSQEHLEAKIATRISKEFSNPNSEEVEIIEGLKQENLKFVPRVIKQQRDGEFFVKIEENVREKDVHLFHKFDDKNLDLVELLVMVDALKIAGVNSVTLYSPYLPYQRQDKKDDGRVPIAARLIFDLVATSFGKYLKRIVTFDLHARQAQGYLDCPVDELSAIPEFAAYYQQLFQSEFERDRSSVFVVSPDAGGAKRARYLAKLLGTQYAVLDKKRTGHGTAEHTFYLPADVSYKKVILVDDMVDSGSSVVGESENNLIGPVQYLQSRRAEIYLCATHSILSQKGNLSAEQRLREAHVPCVFTDSVAEKRAGYYIEHADWMSVVSLDYVLAKAFYCNQVGESISQFLTGREKKLLDRKLDILVHNGTNGVVDVE